MVGQRTLDPLIGVRIPAGQLTPFAYVMEFEECKIVMHSESLPGNKLIIQINTRRLIVESREKAAVCIKRCEESAQDLRDLSEQVPNQQVSNMFANSAEKIEESIKQCKSALNQLK